MYGQSVPQKTVEAGYNKLLAAQLDSIFNEDQQYRVQSDEIEKKFGWDSKENNAL
jgi:hypothetical protein